MKKNKSVCALALVTAVLFCLSGCSAALQSLKNAEASASAVPMESVVSAVDASAEVSVSPEESASPEEAAAPEASASAEASAVPEEGEDEESASAGEESTSAERASPSESTENGEDESAEERKPLEQEQSTALSVHKGSVLVFASDFQHKDGWKDPPETLSGVLDAVYGADLQPDNILFCGDYTTLHGQKNYYSDTHLAVEKIKSIVLDHDKGFPVEDMIFVQGNHDKLTDDISESGLHEYSDYLVYVLNTEKDYPWRQGKKKLKKEVQQGALRLKKCLESLKEKGEMRPIFLAGHVPLHFSGRTSKLQGTGDNLYAAQLFEVINEEAEELNLVYLYGHNHSRGWDSYLGGSCVFRAPGDWILVPRPGKKERVTSKYSKETIHFTYLNAGYVGYFSSAGGEDALTCTVCELFDDSLRFSRYDENGLHILSGEGTPNPAKDDRALIPEKYYGTVLDSPFSVGLKKYSAVVLKKAA